MVQEKTKSILILGNGSMGQRRSRIIHNLRPDWKRTTVDPVNGDLRQLPDDRELFGYSAVFICTPPHLHYSELMLFLDQDVPLFIEKPLVTPDALGMEFIGSVRQFKPPLMIGHNLLHHPGYLNFQKEAGQIGQILYYEAYFGYQLSSWSRANQDPYSKYRSQGGGALLDCLQDVDIALTITGGLDPVFHYQKTGDGITHDSEYLSITHAVQPGSELVAHLHFDYINPIRIRRHAAYGREGTAVWVEDRGPDLDQSYVTETSLFLDWVDSGRKPRNYTSDPFQALDFVRRVYRV